MAQYSRGSDIPCGRPSYSMSLVCGSRLFDDKGKASLIKCDEGDTCYMLCIIAPEIALISVIIFRPT